MELIALSKKIFYASVILLAHLSTFFVTGQSSQNNCCHTEMKFDFNISLCWMHVAAEKDYGMKYKW